MSDLTITKNVMEKLLALLKHLNTVKTAVTTNPSEKIKINLFRQYKKQT